MGQYIGYIAAGIPAGLLGIWLLIRWWKATVAAKEQAEMSLAGEKAHTEGEATAHEAENAAKAAADKAKKGENANPLDM